MATTDNYKLAQLELTNSANFPVLLNNTFKTIDKGLILDVGTSTGTGNNYVLNLGSISLSSANKGISFKFWSDKDSNGAVTINGTYHLVKASGNPVKNLKRNAPYTITYDGGTNFFLASGGVDDVNFSASDLLENKSANNSDGEKVNGTMKNNGSVTKTMALNSTITLPKGYYDAIKITQNVTAHGDITPGNSIVKNGDKVYCRIPQGAYFTNASGGYPEISYPQNSVTSALGFNENNVVGNVGGINGNGLVYRTGTIEINNTDLTSAEYSIQLSQLNLPRTPKFVSCNWRITWYRREYGEEKTYTNSDYAFFDFVNSKCYYPTNTEWSHDSGGTYKIVDTIRKFTDHNLLRMHTESNNRSRVPTKGDDSSFRREPMIVDWFAVA